MAETEEDVDVDVVVGVVETFAAAACESFLSEEDWNLRDVADEAEVNKLEQFNFLVTGEQELRKLVGVREIDRRSMKKKKIELLLLFLKALEEKTKKYWRSFCLKSKNH